MNREALQKFLPLFGAIPFAGSAVLLLFGVDSLPYLGRLQPLVALYGVVIGSFMAGVHWGQHLHTTNAISQRLAIASNLLALALWFCALLIPQWLLVAVSIVLVILWLIDGLLLKAKVISASYFRIRTLVTGIVLISLLIAEIYQ